MLQDEDNSKAAILIVDADKTRCAVLVEYLIAAGFQTTVASDGLDAFAKVQTDHFDLVITGLIMSRMDGLELLAGLQNLFKNLPVIAIGDANAPIDDVYLRCAVALGAKQTHKFPFKARIFVDSVRRVLRSNRGKAADSRE